MRSAMILAVISLGAALATAAPASAQPADETGPEVSVQREGPIFRVAFDLPGAAPVWAFASSSLIMETRQPWRLEQWRVVTPGVVLERVGAYDILRAADGGPVPARVEIEARPRHENLEADYSILMFTDGAVAIPSGIFDLFPLDSIAAAATLPSDLNGVEISAGPARVHWSDPDGQILFMGERYDGVTSQDAQTYVVFGETEMVAGERLMTVTDPALPGWVSDEIQSFAPRVADYYAERLGSGAFDRPTILASWNGPTPSLVSLGGSVMPGLIAMAFEGVGVVEPQPETLAQLRWFISHEAAHFWLGQTVSYAFAREAWITEGGADLMAYRVSQALDPAFDPRSELQTALDDCTALALAPVAQAGDRGEHRAYYACGSIFALVAESVQHRADGGDGFDFLRWLIEQNRDDGTVSRDEWLAHLTAVSGDASLAADIALLLDHGAADPQAVLASLLARAGVAAHVHEGLLRLD